jgi:hypothetical protein
MDPDIKIDLGRFERELEALSAASTKREEWAGKESRHQANIRSLIQLLINRAIEVNATLPAKIGEQARRLGMQMPMRTHASHNVGKRSETAEPKSESKAEQPRDTELPTNNRTEFVRRVVHMKADSGGVTPSEIKAVAKSLGMTIPANFPHTILFKLKKAKQVREQGGRYYPAEAQ